MRTTASFLTAGIALMLTGNIAPADVPPPAPQPKEVPITVEVDENAKESKLIVPQHFVLAPRVRPKIGGLNTNTAVAGVALSLSLVCGGLYLTRRRTPRGAILGLAAAVLLGAGAYAFANPAPPPKAPSREPAPNPAEVAGLPVALDGKIRLEISQGRGESIRLVLDKDSYAKLKEQPKKK